MSKQKSTTKLAIVPEVAKPRVEGWDKAIADAEEMILSAEAYAKQLRRSIKIFKELRDSGAPFPGASKAA